MVSLSEILNGDSHLPIVHPSSYAHGLIKAGESRDRESRTAAPDFAL